MHFSNIIPPCHRGNIANLSSWVTPIGYNTQSAKKYLESEMMFCRT